VCHGYNPQAHRLFVYNGEQKAGNGIVIPMKMFTFAEERRLL